MSQLEIAVTPGEVTRRGKSEQTNEQFCDLCLTSNRREVYQARLQSGKRQMPRIRDAEPLRSLGAGGRVGPGAPLSSQPGGTPGVVASGAAGGEVGVPVQGPAVGFVSVLAAALGPLGRPLPMCSHAPVSHPPAAPPARDRPFLPSVQRRLQTGPRRAVREAALLDAL